MKVKEYIRSPYIFWSCVIVIVFVSTMAIWLFERFQSNNEASHHAVQVDINDLIKNDKELHELLIQLKVNQLPNYDPIVDRLKDMGSVLERLGSSPTEIPIGSRVAELSEKFAEFKLLIEALKSDMAAIRNSSNYLPQLMLDSALATDPENASEELKRAHQNLLLILNFRFESDTTYWTNEFNANIDSIRRHMDKGTNPYVDEIKKHFDIIHIYQQRITESFKAIEKNGFSASAQELSSFYILAYEARYKLLRDVKGFLQFLVFVLMLLTLASFLRIRFQSKMLREENQYSMCMNTALVKLAEFDNKEADLEYFDLCVKCILEASNCYIAYVAFFEGGNLERLQTVSVWKDGKEKLGNFNYAVKGSPCADTIAAGRCIVEEGVAEQYPEDTMLADLSLQAYFAQTLRDENGNPIGLIVLTYQKRTHMQDWLSALLEIFATRISIELERNKAANELFGQKEEAVITLNAIADGVIQTDASGTIKSINPAAQKMLDLDDNGCHKKTVRCLFRQDDTGANDFAAYVESCLDTKKAHVRKKQLDLTTKDGKALSVHLSVAPIMDMSNTILGIVAVLHDVTHELKFINKLAYQANHDNLTGILNRHALQARFTELIENHKPGTPCALMFIDLDRFKLVNDTCGHAAGDALLKDFVELLKDNIRDSDTLARLGGDEFCIILEHCPLERARSIAEKILEQAKSIRFFWEENEFQLSASIGMTSFDSPSQDYNELMSIVDMACLEAKNQGRNRLQIAYPDDSKLPSRKEEGLWMPRLQAAIENNDFMLYQQSIVKSSKLVQEANTTEPGHVEILIRMCDKFGNLLMPGEFLSAAERYDLMAQIDRWVIRNVLTRMNGKSNSSALSHMDFVAINLSGQSLADETLLDFILDEIARNDIEPGRLCFEVTETVAISNYANAIQLLNELHKAGSHFALDDFGSGLSSFGYIKNLPADFIKIDREFTRGLTEDRVNRAIIESIVGIAHNIGMQVIAEGIEDRETQKIVEDFGVDYMQGYTFDYPGPVDKITEKNKDAEIVAETEVESSENIH